MISQISGLPMTAGGPSPSVGPDPQYRAAAAATGVGERGETAGYRGRGETPNRIDPPRAAVATEALQREWRRDLPDDTPIDMDAPAGPRPTFEQSLLDRRMAELIAPPDLSAVTAPGSRPADDGSEWVAENAPTVDPSGQRPDPPEPARDVARSAYAATSAQTDSAVAAGAQDRLDVVR